MKLSNEFSTERNLLIVNSFLMYLYFFDFNIINNIPFLNIDNSNFTNETTLVIFLLLTIYFLFRIIIEWHKSDLEAKNKTSNKIDFYISLIIGIIAIICIVYKLTSSYWIWNFPKIPFIILLVIGELIASLTTLNIQNIVFIRTKEQSNKLGLSRIPHAVKATLYLYTPLTLLVLLLTWAITHYFASEQVRLYWYIIIMIPFIIHGIGLLAYFVFPDKEMRKSLQEIFDKHDRSYQLIYRNKDEDKNIDLTRKVTDDEYEHILKELKKGRDPNEIVAEGGWTFFMYSVAQGDYRLANLLLDYGADVNIRNTMGRSALSFATKYGYKDISELLINNGSNVNVGDKCIDDIPIIEATKNGNLHIVQLLVNHNVDVFRQDSDGKRALEYAEKNSYGDIAKILRKIENIANKTQEKI